MPPGYTQNLQTRPDSIAGNTKRPEPRGMVFSELSVSPRLVVCVQEEPAVSWRKQTCAILLPLSFPYSRHFPMDVPPCCTCPRKQNSVQFFISCPLDHLASAQQ